jgi:hypothetical protein
LPEPEEGFQFASLPDELLNKGKYRSYRAKLKEYLYRHESESIYKTALVKGHAPAGDKSDAVAYFTHRLHEQRDEATEKLRDKYEAKAKSLEKKIRKAEERVEREKAQSRTSWISAGTAALGAVLGGFLGGRRTGMTTVARGVGYASQQGGDVRRAEDALRALAEDMQDLNEELNDELDELNDKYDVSKIELEETEIPPRKSDLKVEDPLILWQPWQVDSTGIATPLY